MIARIIDGRLTLEGIRIDEAKLLHEALEKWTLDLTDRAVRLELEALDRLDSVRGRRAGKTQATRVAGELRQEASGWRALARDGADLLRALAWIATHKDAR